MIKSSRDKRTKAELLEEIEQLRARLDDAEQTLDAIRSGDVDALVVAGPQGDQVFSLTGAERTYRLIIETMNEAALTVDLAGTILFCNQRFSDLVKSPMAEIIGRKLSTFAARAQQAPLQQFLANAQAGSVQRSLKLLASGGAAVSVQIAGSPLMDTGNTSICLVASDLTELEEQADSIRVLLEHQQALEKSKTELQTANAALLQSRLAALNVSEDAIAARRQAEELTGHLLREVTERKQAEQALIESESLFRALFENSLDAVFLTIPDGSVISANPAACSMFGMSEEEIIRVGRAGLIDPNDPKHAAVVEERERARRLDGVELEYIRKNGQRFPAEVDSVILPGELQRAFVILRDITERKQAEETLKKVNAGLESLVAKRTQALADMIEKLQLEIADRKKAEESVQRLNRLYAVLSATSRAIVRTKDRETLFNDFCRIAVENGCFKLAWVGFVDEENQELRVAASAGATGYLEDIRITVNEEPAGLGPTGITVRDGSYYVCNDFLGSSNTRPWHEKGRAHGIRASASIALKQEGRVVGALTLYADQKDFFDSQHVELLQQMGADVSFALDIIVREARRQEAEQALREETSERLRAEAEIRTLNAELEQRVIERTAQLKSANRELEAFSFSVSHDLRAPLRAIDGFSRLALENYHDLLGEKGGDYLQRIHKATQRMDLLIDDLLKLSRLTSGEMNKSSVDLSLLAEMVAAELRRSQTGRRVDFLITEGLIAQCDKRLIKVVLDNLLGNAWKFTGNEAKAIIEFGSMLIEGTQTYFVRDNGAGFNMAAYAKLFGPFQRLHLEREFPGTGIGLSLVRRIIHRHGGNVWAEGKVGQGATFYFTLAPTS